MLLCFPEIADASPSDKKLRTTERNCVIATFLYFAVRFMPEQLNRYVEPTESYVHCHTFRLPKKIKAVSLNLMYEEIYIIEYKKKFGVFEYLYLYENSLDCPVVISFCFRRHRKLFAEICSGVAKKNPNAAISPELREKINKWQ